MRRHWTTRTALEAAAASSPAALAMPTSVGPAARSAALGARWPTVLGQRPALHAPTPPTDQISKYAMATVRRHASRTNEQFASLENLARALAIFWVARVLVDHQSQCAWQITTRPSAAAIQSHPRLERYTWHASQTPGRTILCEVAAREDCLHRVGHVVFDHEGPEEPAAHQCQLRTQTCVLLRF